MTLLERIATAPISWGVCEMPGWGYQLPAESVLAEHQWPTVADTLAEVDKIASEHELALEG